MDVGTIADRLADGVHANLRDLEKTYWNRVISRVFKDIELVWHNRCTFHFEGSVIFCMEDVCARRVRCVFEGTMSCWAIL